METLDQITGILVRIIEIVSGAILLSGFLKASAGLIRMTWKENALPAAVRITHLRHSLGTYILLGLDFYIISDILYTMIRPGLDELINLILIVFMRTMIGFFLGKEILEIERTQHT